MNLARPLLFIDIEATGADPLRERIVEIAIIKRMPNGELFELVERINPGINIPVEVVAIHGITNDDVMNAPTFKDLALTLLEFFADGDFAGFGILRFDIPILEEEFRRAGIPFSAQDRSHLDSLAIYHQRERRDLTAAYQFYCNKKLEGAHGARADAHASMEVLIAQLERYPDLPKEPHHLHKVCNKQDDRYIDSTRKFVWRDGEAAFNFGKYKGELLKDIIRSQRDYIEWIISDAKFAQPVIDLCWRALRGDFPKRSDKSVERTSQKAHS